MSIFEIKNGEETMLEFQLFRIKVFPSKQLSIFGSDLSRAEILRLAIASLPSAELRKGMIWKIGNIVQIDESGLYFRVGRTSKSTIEIYKDGNFIDTEFETAPYTHVILDKDVEVCAIAKKSRLSSKTVGIANQFIRLLNESETAKKFKSNFIVSEITDPEDFISYLRNSYSIYRFWISFTRPNSWDVNKDFIEPTQKLVEESNSVSGKTQLDGNNLNARVLEELTRSAAATGDNAAAWLQPRESEKIIKKQLKGKNPVLLFEDEFEDFDIRKGLLIRLRILYQKIRLGETN